MKKLIFTLLIFAVYSNRTFATWSVIVIDPITHEIGIVGASCTSNCDGIGKVIPGVGAIMVQAMSNNKARKKGAEMILAGASPAEIIQALRDPAFDPERQQYAIVTIKYMDSPATYTGDSTSPYNGALTWSGVSVQGNILSSAGELAAIMRAVEKGQRASLSIAEILMSALEAGAAEGGDKRCGEQKAASSFLVIAKPNDAEPYLHLNISGQDKGGGNAVEMLRREFENWKRQR